MTYTARILRTQRISVCIQFCLRRQNALGEVCPMYKVIRNKIAFEPNVQGRVGRQARCICYESTLYVSAIRTEFPYNTKHVRLGHLEAACLTTASLPHSLSSGPVLNLRGSKVLIILTFSSKTTVNLFNYGLRNVQ